ncbi:BED zinc finger family protein [Loa loa]|uniref:BED zinc finger family protein n=2 Tax=Loa loa TaxID=7209 RepID=A0A1S0U7M8_LOALO|nr:BED zinc finger family protein [Loa loa]EFO26564.1 BED zinc finger family protein [Loa loa]
MGGSTMKTAKVWKYFIQLPSEEQAAECRICCKRIKATNSSTTGMIRHLRSCHSSEYQILQAARQNNATSKQENETLNIGQNNPTKKSRDVASHSVANIIATTFDIRRKHLENSIRYIYADNGPEQKKAKFDECCNAVDLRLEPKNRINRKEQAEKTRVVRENLWPDDHPDAQRISDQIGIMLLLDNESPAIISRIGFRNLLRFLQPRYQIPSTEQFHKVILPRLIGQLRFDAISLQHTGFVSSQQSDLNARLSSLTTILLAKEYDVGNFISNENNREHAAFNSIYSEQKELERVVINSILSAQNISQSFSHSIQLCDEDTDSSVEFETTLSARIDSFMKRIGECIFPQAELTDLVTRCYYACRHLEELSDDGQHQSQLNIHSPLRSSDLADCVEYVNKNLERIHEEHKRSPIPMFKPFTDDETQFLSDLNMHIHSMYLRS